MGHFLQHCRRRSSTSACGVQRALQLASHLAALQSPLAPRSCSLTQPTVQMTSAALLTVSRCKCFSPPSRYWHFVTHSLRRLQTNMASPHSEAATSLGIHGQRLPVGAQRLELLGIFLKQKTKSVSLWGKKSWYLLKEILFKWFTSTSHCIMDLASLQVA